MSLISTIMTFAVEESTSGTVDFCRNLLQRQKHLCPYSLRTYVHTPHTDLSPLHDSGLCGVSAVSSCCMRWAIRCQHPAEAS